MYMHICACACACSRCVPGIGGGIKKLCVRSLRGNTHMGVHSHTWVCRVCESCDVLKLQVVTNESVTFYRAGEVLDAPVKFLSAFSDFVHAIYVQ